MILHALALVLASAPAPDATLSVKVVSLEFSYPYFGEPGNTCQRGSVYVRAVADAKPVVVRMVDSAGLTPGSEAVLADVRRAGTGRDGTAVYCAGGRRAAGSGTTIAATTGSAATGSAATGSAATGSAASGSAASGSAASGSAASGSAASGDAAGGSAASGSAATGSPKTGSASSATIAPPLVQAQPAPAAGSAPPTPAPEPTAGERCVARRFDIIKKPLADKKFGPSEFDPESGSGEPEVVDCSLARSRVTNVLLVRMVKDGFSTPAAVVGAEWSPGSTWQKTPDAPQRRAATVYLVESR